MQNMVYKGHKLYGFAKVQIFKAILRFAHATRDKFENRCFTLQKHQLFYVHITRRNLKTQQ